MNKYLTIFFLLSCINEAICQKMNLYSWSYVNLIQSKQIGYTNTESELETSVDYECSGSESIVNKNGDIKVKAHSSNCSPTNHANAIGAWKSQLKFKGNKGLSIPLKVNFEISGSTKVSTSTGPKCAVSISSVILDSDLQSNFEQHKSYINIQHQNGFQTKLSNFKNINKDDGYSIITPQIKIEDNLINVGNDWKHKFIKAYLSASADALTANNANLSTKMLQYLNDGIPIIEGPEIRLSEEAGYMVNAIMYLLSIKSDLSPLTLNTNNIAKITIGFDVDFVSKFTRGVKIKTEDAIFLNAYLNVGAQNIPACETKAEIDFSNTLKIKSITISDDYFNPNVDLADLKVILDTGIEIPVQNNKVLAIEDSSKQISIYPNPTDGRVNIEFSNNEFVQNIYLFDLKGNLVLNNEINRSDRYFNIKIPNQISSQQLFLKIKTDNNNYIKKLLYLAE